MPLYEYICLACEDRFDARRALEGAEPSCPSCGADRVRRQLSMFASAGNGGPVGGNGGCACGGACACGH
jgi:putative FmdB family regulatory protein